MIVHIVSDVYVHMTLGLLCCLQDEGDYLCVKVLRHSKSKKTMVSTNFLGAGCDDRCPVIVTFKCRCGRTCRPDALDRVLEDPCWSLSTRLFIDELNF